MRIPLTRTYYKLYVIISIALRLCDPSSGYKQAKNRKCNMPINHRSTKALASQIPLAIAHRRRPSSPHFTKPTIQLPSRRPPTTLWFSLLTPPSTSSPRFPQLVISKPKLIASDPIRGHRESERAHRWFMYYTKLHTTQLIASPCAWGRWLLHLCLSLSDKKISSSEANII